MSDNTSAWAQYTIQMTNRHIIQERFKLVGIPTSVHYPIPLNKQPALVYKGLDLPFGDSAAQKVLSLPMHPYLSLFDIQHIVEVLNKE